jgi:hypothetical protein
VADGIQLVIVTSGYIKIIKGLLSTTKYDTATAGIISALTIQPGHREVVNRGTERNRERSIGFRPINRQA